MQTDTTPPCPAQSHDRLRLPLLWLALGLATASGCRHSQTAATDAPQAATAGQAAADEAPAAPEQAPGQRRPPGLGDPCGAEWPSTCADGLFCAFSSKKCDSADHPGTCTAWPATCDGPQPKVCACDGGRVFTSICEARAARESRLVTGGCE